MNKETQAKCNTNKCFGFVSFREVERKDERDCNDKLVLLRPCPFCDCTNGYK